MTWHAHAAAVAAAAGIIAAAATGRLTGKELGSPRVPDAPRTVVIAELFTSEGCSSCPSADRLLRRLLATQPIDGVEVVALGNHVDYWDGLGWRDPFSSRLFSNRQAVYDSVVFRSKGAYTPQLVVDGVAESVASDERAVRTAVLNAAARPKGSLFVATSAAPGDAAALHIHAELPPSVLRHGPADVVVAVTEDDLSSRVQRGENQGRLLVHSAVVRTLSTAARVGALEHEATLDTTVPLDPRWNRPRLRFVAFVQEQESRRIIAAGASPLGLTAAGPRLETGDGR